MYLGIDGGGTKTAFALGDAQGRVLARHEEGSLYYLEIGLDGVEATLARGAAQVLAAAGVPAAALRGVYVGLPAFGEDSALQPRLEALPGRVLPGVANGVGCDMHCSWAGSLAGRDGISVIAGTGSMAYGEVGGRGARTGGWGELFGDEGSAHWIAREGLSLFARMSDGRRPRGPLHALVVERLALGGDLDLCARIYGDGSGANPAGRSAFAQFSKLVRDAAEAGDAQAEAIFERAAGELAELVVAARRALGVADDRPLPVSYSGGLFGGGSRVLAPFAAALEASGLPFELQVPVMAPVLGAVWLAARAAGAPLSPAALARLAEAP
jgi:N-acetylglucosamine kinase-like BadF-type ATPase